MTSYYKSLTIDVQYKDKNSFSFIQYMFQICSLSTIAREYVALRSIGSLPFKDIILGAAEKNINSEGQAWKISGPLKEYIKENLNESQQNAIQVS